MEVNLYQEKTVKKLEVIKNMYGRSKFWLVCLIIPSLKEVLHKISQQYQKNDN